MPVYRDCWYMVARLGLESGGHGYVEEGREDDGKKDVSECL